MNQNEKKWPYHDIVNLPHHVSAKHPQMAMIKRAAQFAPFAALTGYEAVVEESARLTGAKIELDETELEILDRKIAEALEKRQEVKVVYFLPDEKKEGGAYTGVTGRIKKAERGQIILDSGKQIPVGNVLDIDLVDRRSCI